MRKLILYTLTSLTALSGFGQSAAVKSKAARQDRTATVAVNTEVNLEASTFYNRPASAGVQTPSTEATGGSRGGGAQIIKLGQSGNIFTLSADGPNQVSYNSDINSITFTHRQTAGVAGGSGGVDYDVSTDGGATWTTDHAVTPDYNGGTVYAGVLKGNRFPNGTIYNPSGNTDPDNAYNVFLGVAHDDDAATDAWGYTYLGSAQLDGTSIDENYEQWEGESEEYIPAGLDVTSTGTIYGIAPTLTRSGSTDFLNYLKMRLFGGVFNSLSESVLWGYTNWTPDLFTYLSSGTTVSLSSDYNIAFGPDGMTGYAVLASAGASDPLIYPHPYVSKTTDGGLTWTELPYYAFNEMPEMTDFILETPTGETLPYIISMDVTVDASNRLHIFSETYSKYTANTDADSIAYYSGFDDGAGNFLNYSVMMHWTTTDGTDWTAKALDNFILGDGVLDGATELTYSFRPQAGRTEDGSKVFFTWIKSDTTLTVNNDIPDVYGIGYDPYTGLYTPVKNLSEGSTLEYSTLYPTLAPVVISGGDDYDYELPIVAGKLTSDFVNDDTTSMYYMKGVGFNDSEFGAEPAPSANYTFSVSADGATYTFTNTSSGATSYSWDFGDGSATTPAINPPHTFTASGTYTVCLTATNAAGDDTECKDLNVVLVGIQDLTLDNALNVYPTLSGGIVHVNLETSAIQTATVEVLNMTGETVMGSVQLSGNHELDLTGLADGNYMLKIISDEGGMAVRRITIAK